MIPIILLVAGALRLISINQSLWLDEGINVNVVSHSGFWQLISKYSLGDFHPPLYHVILKSWILIFGNSEMSVRTPSVIFGVAAVYLTYLIAKNLFERRTALIAATLIATSPLHIYYSQEARMYMMAAFFTAASVYFFVRILEQDKLLFWLGFITSTALMLYSDYLPYLMLPVYGIFLFFQRRKISRHTQRTFIPAFIIILIFLTPWIYLFPKQFAGGFSVAAASPAWARVVGGATFKNFLITYVKFTIGRISLNDKLLYALLFAPIALYVVSLFSLSILRLTRKRSFLWLWLFTPTVLAFLISFYVPIFAYFRFVFVLPAFYIILASGVNVVNWQAGIRLLLAIFLLINLSTVSIYYTNPRFQREDWRGATDYIRKNYAPKTLILFESTDSVGPFDYYSQNQFKAAGALDSFTPNPQKVKARVESQVADISRIYLFQYLAPITDPQGIVFAALNKQGFVNTSVKDFTGVGFIYEFKR